MRRHRRIDLVVAMAEDRRAIAQAVVDVFVAVDVGEARPQCERHRVPHRPVELDQEPAIEIAATSAAMPASL